jgi:hypothetical protein
LDEEKSKHVGLAQQNWVFFSGPSCLKGHIHQKKEQPVRGEECNKYDLIMLAAPLFLIGQS